jgi:glyoxylase-like metal-dependent hydrolase (beta-lactamase superfamily II)
VNPVLIPIRQDKPGFKEFIGAWVYQGHRSIIVDVGPSRSINLLVQSLRELEIERIDFVLLTHIHADHAGGLAEFLRVFPMAMAICHLKAINHLVDPAKLWLGTQKALGELALTYGPISPVEKGRLIPHMEARLPGLEIIETPGHAPNHLCFLYEGNLFAGEAGGIYLKVHGAEYLRPATPPVFFLKESVDSIDRLIPLGDLPIFYSHFGRAEMARPMLQRSREQMLFWEKIVSEEFMRGREDVVERCAIRLFEEDPELKAIQIMAPEDQARERFFLKNSLKGYLGYLQHRSSHSLQQRS